MRGKGYTVSGIARREGASGADRDFLLDLRELHRAPEKTSSVLQSIHEFLDGQLDLLVNNAAYQVVKEVEDLTAKDLDETLTTNVIGRRCLE